MTKLRRQRKRKVYRYDVNRKRLMKKSKRLPKIQCDQLKSEWDKRKSTKVNLCKMGLMHNPNENIKIPNTKPSFAVHEAAPVASSSSTSQVVEDLVADAKAPRERVFRLPQTHVHWLTKCIDKYGEDYEAMSRDRKLNIFQHTPNQLKAKVKRFKGIPEQYNEYLKTKQSEPISSS